MSDEKIHRVDPTSSITNEGLRAEMARAKDPTALIIHEQIESDESMMMYAEQGSEFNPLAMGKDFRELHKQLRRDVQTAAEVAEEQAEEAESPARIAEQFSKKNPELNPKALLAMRANILPKDSREDILSKVRNVYPDASLADDALDFLISSSAKNSTLRAQLITTKEEFNEIHGRDIRAGKNIQQVAREFSQHGLGNPNALRDLYRSVVANPREANTLFEELSNSFTFDKMKVVIGFILHSLGQDIKSKGPSISPAELQRLFSEARTMQAILGVYKFFASRMALIKGEFKRADLSMPATLSFQNLAKAFMAIIKDRYPNAQRILGFANMLGVSEETLAKIIAFNQLRDALRNVSPKLFKAEQHRQDMLSVFIEALSDLEDDLEDELEDDDEEEEES